MRGSERARRREARAPTRAPRYRRDQMQGGHQADSAEGPSLTHKRHRPVLIARADNLPACQYGLGG
jgi:hypothetical protein